LLQLDSLITSIRPIEYRVKAIHNLFKPHELTNLFSIFLFCFCGHGKQQLKLFVYRCEKFFKFTKTASELMQISIKNIFF